jgi:hypothetical protein
LIICLRPKLSTYGIADAILNGVEVFKLSDYDKNLAGPNPKSIVSPPPTQKPASTANESKAKKTIIVAMGSGAGSFLVVLCCMLLWKLKYQSAGCASLLHAFWLCYVALRFLLSTIKVQVLARARQKESQQDEHKKVKNKM